MTYYCYLDSEFKIESTNLQLYSLRKAANEWNDLINLFNENEAEGVDNLKERLAFIINCFGLSLSQLMGQNSPSPDKEKMDQPGDLFSNLLNRTGADRMTKKRLNIAFRDFLTYYSAIRHFGKVKNDKNYKSLDKLTVAKLDGFRKMTIEMWDLIIEVHRKNKINKIDEFRSISELVCFEELKIEPS